MAQTNFTPISLYYSATATNVPTAANLVAGELAINTADGKLFYKDSAGVVQTIASKDTNSGTFTNISVSGVASFADGTVSLPSITNIGDTNTGIFFPAADTIAFTEGGTESMRIDSSGNLIVGATSQIGSAKFGVQRSTAGECIRWTDGATGGVITTVASFGTNISSDALSFTTNSTERMRVTSGGDLCVNRTSSLGAVKFVVESDTTTYNPMTVSNTRSTAATDYSIIFYRNGSIVGSVQTSLSATSYVTSSDYRLKENIAPMTGALNKVQALKPVTYDWKTGGSSQGFIAHELAEVCPEAVTGEKDAVNDDGSIKPQGIDTSFLVATLTAAIQEQQTIIENLTTRLNALEGK